MSVDSRPFSIPLVFRMGGGLVFAVEGDGVQVLSIRPGMKGDDVLPVLGTVNREHLVMIATEILKEFGLTVVQSAPPSDESAGTGRE